jgi:hypothetical protein
MYINVLHCTGPLTMFNGISYFQILSWLTQITHEAWSTFMEAQLQEFVPLSDQHMCRPRLAQPRIYMFGL